MLKYHLPSDMKEGNSNLIKQYLDKIFHLKPTLSTCQTLNSAQSIHLEDSDDYDDEKLI